MAESLQPSSTLIDIEVPDVATPDWTAGLPQPLLSNYPSSPYVPPSPIQARSHVQFASSDAARSMPVHSFVWGEELMQLCTPSPAEATTNVSPVSSHDQYDLPGTIPTPARGIGDLTAQVQGNWDKLYDFMGRQETAVTVLTSELKLTSAQHKNQLKSLSEKVDNHTQQISTILLTTKQQAETETDQMVKTMKLLMLDEFQKIEKSLVSNICSMVEKLQLEVQKDIKTVQQNFQKSHDVLNQDFTQLTAHLDHLSVKITELQESPEYKTEDPPKNSESSSQYMNVNPPVNTGAVKSDHLKLTFPTFGRPSDDSDPLLYLAKCQDFLAIHPLTDSEILATFRTVLHGTARDWWEVTRTTVTAWHEFESSFLIAFLSEDYEDELAERVRIRIQGERESIRDFAFTYRALCKRWKPTLTESELVKMTLKNIKPYLASQLRGRVTTVEDLVRLGQQLEKDHLQQLQYNYRVSSKQVQSGLKGPLPPVNRPVDKPQVQCWRCKGQHAPSACPHFPLPSPSFPPPEQPSANLQRSYPPRSRGKHTNNSMTTANALQPKVITHSQEAVVVPQQLIVPIGIGDWVGKAIVDTGASFTLIHEHLWKEFNPTEHSLNPWSLGPLYLANGMTEVPLGWLNLSLELHGHVCTLPVAVLTSKALAYSIVLGLDFIFFSGMQIKVSDGKYSFSSVPEVDYLFQLGHASVPTQMGYQHLLNENQAHYPTSSISLLSSIPPLTPPIPLKVEGEDTTTLINHAVDAAHLPPGQKLQLSHLLRTNPQVCTLQLGRTAVLQHQIYTHHQIPIKQRPYRVSPAKQAIVNQQLREMLDAGIVEPSQSGWASPVVLVPKKDGRLRFCVDYRKLNAITESDAYPLPNLTEILESLSGSAIFSTLDLNSGYWQVTMDTSSKAKTAFTTSAGLFHFNVMPFGLKNAPSTFQRLMETVLGELRGKNCFVYIDDIIVYSPSVTQHFLDLQAVFQKLQDAGLTINLRKSKFCLHEVTFLGHLVNIQGISADPSKVEAIRTYPVPRNLKEVQRFLGLAGWYHRFVSNFSRIAEPLNSLKKKGRTFQWTLQCQQAFEQLKTCLMTPPILGHPNLEHPFMVYTDASEIGLGAVLTQKRRQGIEEVIAYASRTLNPAETNYSATEKECLAVVWALDKWQHYLDHKMFTVVTDHSALQWVMNSPKTTSRLIRWALQLQKYDFIVEYRKGKLNAAPDALSRITPHTSCNLYSNKTDVHNPLPVTAEVIWEKQHNDPEITKIFQNLAEKNDDQQVKYEVVEDKLYLKTQLTENQYHFRIFVPKDLVPCILEHYHCSPMSGHVGIYKTYKRIQDVAYWPGMWSDIKQFVKRCVKCQTLKADQQKPAGKMQKIVSNRPNQMLGVDIMGPLPRSSNQNEYLLVFVDYFTRWVELFPMRVATAKTVATLFRKEILTRWGVPDFLVSDRGTQFVSAVFKELCESWNVTPKLTTAYHPQTNMTERINRTLKSMMAAYVNENHKRWDQYLPEFRFAINSAVQETTGMSPAELQLGRKLQGPMNKLLRAKGHDLSPDAPNYEVVCHLSQLQAKAKENCKKAHLRQLRNYNKNHRDVLFKEKDRVWIRQFPQSSAKKNFTAKLTPKWKGPYRVIQQMGPVNYRIALESTGEDVRIVHVCNLKPCFPTATELETQEKQTILDLFNESLTEEEEFLGF